jgi:predicted nucleotide-binding protein (sugar kinase/HSP70/actin superfamily)
MAIMEVVKMHDFGCKIQSAITSVYEEIMFCILTG